MLGALLRSIGRRWQAQREERAVRRRAIPDDLWKRTLVRYPFLRRADAAQAAELRRLASLFLDTKEFSTVGGLRLDNAMVVAIAAQACLPVLKLGLQRYDDFVGIVVHPHGMTRRREQMDEHGVVHEYDEELVGEAMKGGPMTLSWHDIRAADSRGRLGFNVVIHEFAHVLDMADGHSDGVPLLPPPFSRPEWLATLQPAFEAFAARVEQAERDEDDEALAGSAVDPYGATAIDEFFACVSESFFVNPAATRAEHPALYALLSRFYRQDPAADLK